MDRERVSTGTEWEPRVGYSRPVRVGDRILVSGTTPTDADGGPVVSGDPEAQTRRALEIVGGAIESAGGTREDVVRTRLYVTEAHDWGPSAGSTPSSSTTSGRPRPCWRSRA